MEPIWYKEYSPNVPYEINCHRTSLAQLFDESVKKFSHLSAYKHLGHKLSYAELGRLVNELASFFQHRFNIQKGDRIAIMMPNCFASLISLFAALKVGAVVVNVNPLYTGEELATLLLDAKATTVVVLDLFTAELQHAMQKVPVHNVMIATLGDVFPTVKSWLIRGVVRLKERKQRIAIKGEVRFMDALMQGRNKSFRPVMLDVNDLAFLQYTGGTTGKPKGAMLSHGNLLANIRQTEAWFKGVAQEGEEVNVLALPIYHIFSLTVNCFMFLALGGLNIIVTNPRDLSALIKQIANERMTFFIGVNTLLNKLMQHPKFNTIDFNRLKVSVCGGMAVQESVARYWEKATGVTILQGYGLTEASPIIAVNPVVGHRFNGSIGLPLPSTDIKFINDKGNTLAAGEIGELCAKGPQVMQGYWQEPEATAEVIKDGWLATGDIGYVDPKGYIYLKERKKDIIIVSGFNVYPNEVEAVLVEHEKVDEAAVIGIRDMHSGERVKAFIVPLDTSLTEAELVAWCEQSLAKYKQPKFYEFCDELPKTTVGKILRRKLRK